MDKLHWILLIIALGAVALVIMLGLIVTKESKGGYEPVFNKLADDYRNGDYDVMKPLRSDFDSKEVVDNAIKDADKVSNIFDRFQHDIDKVKFKHVSHTKPRITIHNTYMGTKCWYCESGGCKERLIIGIGDNPQQAYKDWLNFMIK